jgi:hypothetical protein
MFWNAVFWIFFAASEALLIFLSASGCSGCYSLAAFLILALGLLKLAEDAKGYVKRVRVKRSILNKLKPPA